MPRIAAAALVVLGVAAAAAGVFLLIAPENSLRRVESNHESFDLVYQLPSSPQGAASNGRELMLGNRKDPWGAMRLRPRGKSFTAKLIPIRERRNDQKMQIHTLAWNGTYYVGLASAAWFGRKTGDVFTVHEPKSMNVVSHHAAPDLLGCLAWDGKSYWAANRRNTADANEPANLYQLDEDFAVIATHEAPSVGCQGMAWDGARLWLVDVFDDSIYVLDVHGDAPRVVHREHSGLEYLSGILVYDDALWVTEYGTDRLHRIRPELRSAWLGPAPRREERRAEPAAAASVFVPRNDQPVLSARRETSFPERESNDVDDIDWSVELRDDAIYGAWRIWFGPDVFVRGEPASGIITIPQFAKYTFTVTLPNGEEIEKEFEATPGDNVEMDVFLADATEPGEYRVDLFMHVQYMSKEGEARIINDSAAGLTLRK
jgi:hypothetical protein